MRNFLVVLVISLATVGCGSTLLGNGSVPENPAYPSTDDRRLHDQPNRMGPAGPDEAPDMGGGAGSVTR